MSKDATRARDVRGTDLVGKAATRKPVKPKVITRLQKQQLQRRIAYAKGRTWTFKRLVTHHRPSLEVQARRGF
jgi:hypothetical protein